jgi:hypothetical protein
VFLSILNSESFGVSHASLGLLFSFFKVSFALLFSILILLSNAFVIMDLLNTYILFLIDIILYCSNQLIDPETCIRAQDAENFHLARDGGALFEMFRFYALPV